VIIGIDPGLTGAVGFIDKNGRFFAVEDLPTMPRSFSSKSAKVKNQINAAELAQLLRPHAAQIRLAIVEQVAARPGQDAATTGSLMHTLGTIEGVLASLSIPFHLVAPAVWKKAMGLGPDKSQARTLAQRMHPEAPLGRVKDHNRAEALLLASWGCRHT